VSTLRPFPADYIITAPDVLAIQTDAETSDRNLVRDLVSGGGIASGLDLTEQSSPNLTLQLSAGVAYDPLGRRLNVPSTQTVNVAADSAGTSTAVGSGNERTVAIYLRFKRTNADAYTTTLGTVVYLTQAESFEVVVVAGASATAGASVPPAAPTGDPILLGRVKLTHAQTTVRTAQVLLTDVPLMHRNADLFDADVQRSLEVSVADPPGMTLVVSAGRVNIDGTHRLFAGGTTSSFTAPSASPRIDLVALNASGALVVVTGTEASSPSRPSTTGYLPIAFVSLAVGQTAILDTHVADARPWLQAQTARRRYHEATATMGQTAIDLPFSYVPGAHAIELIIDGVPQPESGYIETSATRITVSAFAGGEVIVVKALDVAPLSAVALEQVTDDLSGLLVGGDVVAEDRGSGVRLYVAPVAMCVIRRRSYRLLTETTVTPSGLSSGAWYGLYAGESGGTLVPALSTIPTEDGGVWRGDGGASPGHRFLAWARTDSGGAVIPFLRSGGVTLFDRGHLSSTALNVITAQTPTAGTWTTASLASLVPPGVRHVLLEIEVEASSSTNGGAEVRTYGATTGGVTSLTVEAATDAQTIRREAWVICDASQRVQYRRPTGYVGAVTLRVLGFRG